MVVFPEMNTNSSVAQCQLALVKYSEEHDQSIHCFFHMIGLFYSNRSLMDFNFTVVFLNV